MTPSNGTTREFKLLSPAFAKIPGYRNGVLVRLDATYGQVDHPLPLVIRRSALRLSNDEAPMPEINPVTLDVRVASGLFAGLRE